MQFVIPRSSVIKSELARILVAMDASSWLLLCLVSAVLGFGVAYWWKPEETQLLPWCCPVCWHEVKVGLGCPERKRWYVVPEPTSFGGRLQAGTDNTMSDWLSAGWLCSSCCHRIDRIQDIATKIRCSEWDGEELLDLLDDMEGAALHAMYGGDAAPTQRRPRPRVCVDFTGGS